MRVLGGVLLCEPLLEEVGQVVVRLDELTLDEVEVGDGSLDAGYLLGAATAWLARDLLDGPDAVDDDAQRGVDRRLDSVGRGLLDGVVGDVHVEKLDVLDDCELRERGVSARRKRSSSPDAALRSSNTHASTCCPQRG